MSISAVGKHATRGFRDVLADLIDREGSAAHPYLASLSMPHPPMRDLADALHLLCTLHGRTPGVIDLAAARPGYELAADWLLTAAAGFAEERGVLTRLVVAAGPLPSTPGQAETEAAVLGQRHALEMLAGSDRRGCALGAAIALACDWAAVRTMLDAAAARLGIDPLPARLPPSPPPLALPADGALDRALAFGAQQLLVQHRGLWSLLESRSAARDV